MVGGLMFNRQHGDPNVSKLLQLVINIVQGKYQTGKYVVRAEDLRARNGQSSAQNLKNILFKRSGTYKKVPLHMRRRCEGGFLSAQI